MTNEAALGTFLRSRRERVKPEDVGLRSSGRRRTPGLRREELATVAGISVEYLERLEQGRDINPSSAMLAALADALQLSDDDRRHLARLTIERQAAYMPPARPTGDEAVALRTVLECLAPTPACLMGSMYNILAWNPAFETITGRLGLLDDGPPNAARYHFMNPLAHRIFSDKDWESIADEFAGWLRSAQIELGSDERFSALIDELCTVPEFAQRWASHSISHGRQHGVLTMVHPDVGAVRFKLEVLLVGESHQWLQMWVPKDELTRKAMAELISEQQPVEASS